MENNNQEILKFSPAFKEGFNKGYILREHKPDLALSLRQTKFPESEKEYGNGIHAGIDQKEMELVKDNAKGFSFEKLKEEYKDKLHLAKHQKEKDKE